MKKLSLVLIGLLVSIFMMSCNGNKIGEPLSSKDIKKYIESDALYEDIINYVKFVNDSAFEKDLVLKSKYSDITYEEMYEYWKYFENQVRGFSYKDGDTWETIDAEMKKFNILIYSLIDDVHSFTN